MLGAWRSSVDDAFHASTLARQGWIEPHALVRAWERAIARGVVPPQLWYLYVLELWARHEHGAVARETPATARLVAAPAVV